MLFDFFGLEFPIISTSNPIIADGYVWSSTPTTLNIYFNTNVACSSVIDYGTTASYGSTNTVSEFTTSHVVTLTGLTQLTGYHYRVTCIDQQGGSVQSADGYCITKSNLGLNAATLEYLTDSVFRATYDWGTAEQLNDWTVSTSSTATRSNNTLAISGGSTSIHGLRFNLPCRLINYTLTNTTLTAGTSIRAYTNMSTAWTWGTEASPLLGHSWYTAASGLNITQYFKVAAVNTNIVTGSDYISLNTAYTLSFNINSEAITSYCSNTGNTLTLAAAYTPSIAGYSGIGGGGTGAAITFGTVTVTGSVAISMTVDAGANQTITLPVSATATSSFNDGYGPYARIVNYTWAETTAYENTILTATATTHITDLVPGTTSTIRVIARDAAGLDNYDTMTVTANVHPLNSLPARNIVVIGASTAVGTPGPSDIAHSFVGLLTTYIQSLSATSSVINLAIGGNLTSALTGIIAGSVTDALNRNPHAIIVCCSGNDQADGIADGYTQANFLSIEAQANARGVPVWTTTTYPRTIATPVGAQQSLINTKDWILSNMLHPIDFWNGFANTDGTIITRFDSGDHTHENDAGHRKMANRVINSNLLSTVFTDPTALASSLSSIFGNDLIGLWLGEDLVIDGYNRITSWVGRKDGYTLTNLNSFRFAPGAIGARRAAKYGPRLAQEKSLRWDDTRESRSMWAVADGYGPGTNYSETIAYCHQGGSTQFLVRDGYETTWVQSGITHYTDGIASESIPTYGPHIFEGALASSTGTGVAVLGGTALNQTWNGPVSLVMSLANVPSSENRAAAIAVLKQYYTIT